MNTDEKIKEIIDLKNGNKEMAFFYIGNSWEFLLGNTSQFVLLGESEGEFAVSGNSIDDVLNKMKKKLNEKEIE